MAKFLITFLICVVLFSCQKGGPPCQTWIVKYWQGKGDHTVVTTNYPPTTVAEKVCGSGTDTIVPNKNIILGIAGADLYDYKTFISRE